MDVIIEKYKLKNVINKPFIVKTQKYCGPIIEVLWRSVDLPDVHCLGIRDTHRVTTRWRQLGCHGEHSCDAEGYASGLGVLVDPEGNPGEHDYEDRRDVGLEDKETYQTL